MEQTTLVNEYECSKLIANYIDKLRGVDGDATILEFVRSVLMEKVVPHVGTDFESFRKKAYFIGYMARRLLFAFLGKTD